MAALVWMVQAEPAEGFEYRDLVPLGFHNFFVLTVLLFTLFWVMKVAHRAWTVALIHRQLSESRPLTLDGMSIYAKDLQKLIRQHFNQILRMRRLVPPKEVPQHRLQCHLRPETLEVMGGDDLLGVRFIVDARLPCVVRLYWGVSMAACEALLRQFPVEEPEARRPSALAPLPGPVRGPASFSDLRAAAAPVANSPAAPSSQDGEAAAEDGEGAAFWEPLPHNASCIRSSPSRMPAGLGLAYSTPRGELLDPRHLHFELAPSAWPSADRSAPLPLLIVATARRQPREGGRLEENQDGHTQVTLVRFRRRAGSAGSRRGQGDSAGVSELYPEVLQQLILSGAGGTHRVLGVYGFEEEDGGPAECMVCYDRPRSVVLLPCRHCSVCPACLRSLRDEQCPLCRSAFSAYLLFPLLQGA